MSEKLCLKWNDYQENIKDTFRHMREDSDFSDVTLVCEDGQQVEAHKMILAASSPFFQKLLRKNNNSRHPMVYMRFVKLDDLLAIVDFLYRGEANVFQENLDSFLAIAEELQLRGLMGKADDRVEDPNFDGKRPQSKVLPKSNSLEEHPKADAQHSKIDREKSNTTVALPSYYSGDLDQLEEMVKSMMEKSENNYRDRKYKAHRCKVCGKEGESNAIKDHIEANHIEGIVIPCTLCEKTFRSRDSLRHHRQKCLSR